jgi:hypothetical protein
MAKIKKASTIAKRLLKFLGPNGEHWCRGAIAKDRSGREVEIASPKAKRFCLSGALIKLNLSHGPIIEALKPNYSGIASFNDSHYFSSVKKKLQEIAAS